MNVLFIRIQFYSCFVVNQLLTESIGILNPYSETALKPLHVKKLPFSILSYIADSKKKIVYFLSVSSACQVLFIVFHVMVQMENYLYGRGKQAQEKS